MFKQVRLGNDGAGTARTDQPGDSSNQVDEQNCKIAHDAGIVTSGFRITRLIMCPKSCEKWEFTTHKFRTLVKSKKKSLIELVLSKFRGEDSLRQR